MLLVMYPVTMFTLGGIPGAPPERIFASAGAEVRGFSRKGKQFLMFDSNLTEPIKSMYVNKINCMCTASHYVSVCSNHLLAL